MAKKVICMTAMGIKLCSEVESKLKAFMADTNKKHKGAFIGHGSATNEQLLDMVTAYCLESEIVTIRDPPNLSEDGVQRLFPENVELSMNCKTV